MLGVQPLRWYKRTGGKSGPTEVRDNSELGSWRKLAATQKHNTSNASSLTTARSAPQSQLSPFRFRGGQHFCKTENKNKEENISIK